MHHHCGEAGRSKGAGDFRFLIFGFWFLVQEYSRGRMTAAELFPAVVTRDSV
jgi:hypothetical protein